ncbi:hypothetical protein JW933_06895 [candidate division FCPU426 bacterium]|nr:hypothetical protein [candidate division FCPU426 bacterium]
MTRKMLLLKKEGISTMARNRVKPVTATVSFEELNSMTWSRSFIVQLDIDPGWYINLHQPKHTFLHPTFITIKPHPLIKLGSIEYPEGSLVKIPYSPAWIPVYRETAIIRGKIQLAFKPSGTIEPCTWQIYFQACSDTGCQEAKIITVQTPL